LLGRALQQQKQMEGLCVFHLAQVRRVSHILTDMAPEGNEEMLVDWLNQTRRLGLLRKSRDAAERQKDGREESRTEDEAASERREHGGSPKIKTQVSCQGVRTDEGRALRGTLGARAKLGKRADTL
jgi:hypothetical protein